MDRLRLVTLIVGGLALALVALGLATAAYFVDPRGGETMRGVFIRQPGGTGATLLARDGLRCAEDDADQLRTVCRATVAGMPLVITMTRPGSGQWVGASCVAAYGERQAPCSPGFPPYALLDGPALGLDAAAIAAARPLWSPDRWWQEDWERVLVAMVALCGLACAALALNAPIAHTLGRLVVALAIGLTAAIVTAPFLGFAMIALGHID